MKKVFVISNMYPSKEASVIRYIREKPSRLLTETPD